MRPRFQADADVNQKIVGLRRRERIIDFESAHAAGVIGVPDSEVLRIAADRGRILISHDRKTMPAHFARFIGSLLICAASNAAAQIWSFALTRAPRPKPRPRL
jgi:uncharacterized protein with PIN domain